MPGVQYTTSSGKHNSGAACCQARHSHGQSPCQTSILPSAPVHTTGKEKPRLHVSSRTRQSESHGMNPPAHANSFRPVPLLFYFSTHPSDSSYTPALFQLSEHQSESFYPIPLGKITWHFYLIHLRLLSVAFGTGELLHISSHF